MNQQANPQKAGPNKPAAPQKSAPPAPSGAPAPPAPPTEGSTVVGVGGTLTLDFTGVQTEFEPLPVGTYNAVVAEIEHVPHSAKSNEPYLKWVFEITDEGYSGRKLFHNTSLQPAALWKLGKTLEALGVDVPQAEFQLDLRALLGLPCQLAVSVRVHQGKNRNDITDVLPVASGPSQPPFPA